MEPLVKIVVVALVLIMLISLGTEQASADTVMPKEEYSQQHHVLVDPQPIALDHAIRELVTRYGAIDSASSRAAMRNSISGDEIYTLAAFAKRAAAFGMRDRDRSWISSGLTAVAMFDSARMDPRDVPMTLAFLHHASRRIGADTGAMFAQAAKLADAQVAPLLQAFPGRRDTDLVKHWGAAETPTGFIEHGGERWAPTRDLQQAIVRIAAVVNADGRYEVSSVEIAGPLPSEFISGSTRLLRKARGGATFNTSLMNGLMGVAPIAEILDTTAQSSR